MTNNNIKDNTISTWLTWKLPSHTKPFHPDSYDLEFKDLKLWYSLFEILGLSKDVSSTNAAFSSLVEIVTAQGIQLQEGFSIQDIESGKKDAVCDLLIRIIFHYYGLSTLTSQLADIVCEPPYNLPKSDTTDLLSSTGLASGKVLCALVHSKAMVFNFHDATTKKSSVELISFVLDTAEKKLGIPKFFQATDLAKKTLDMLPVIVFVGAVLKHKGVGGLPMPSVNKASVFSSGVSVIAGGAALKKFQDRNLAAEIEQLKQQLEKVKSDNEQEINTTKATLQTNLRKVEKAHFEDTMQLKRTVEEDGKSKSTELKQARDQVNANEEQLKQIEEDKVNTQQQLLQYANKLDDVSHKLHLAIAKKKRERANAVEVDFEVTLDTVRNNYQEIQKKLKQIENLKEILLNKSKSLEEQRAEYAMRANELKDLTSSISDRINFLVNQLEDEKKTQTNIQQTMSVTQVQLKARNEEELKLLRQQEEELKRLKQRMDIEQRKIVVAEQHAEDLFLDNDLENEKTKHDDMEGDFDRADKESLQSELDGYVARRQICYASLERVKQQHDEVDRSHKEVLSELDKLDEEENRVKGMLLRKPPPERVVPQLGALVLLDDEISIIKMMESNLNYDMQEMETELDQLKVEKWNVKTHTEQVHAQIKVIEREIQVMRDMEVISPSKLKELVSDIIEKAEGMAKEKSRLKQWRNYYFGKFNKTNTQLEASGKKDLIKEQLEDDKDEDVDDDEIGNTGPEVSKSGLTESPRGSPAVQRKEKRKSWNLSLRIKGEKEKAKFSQSFDDHLAPPVDGKSKRRSITGAFASLVPKLFSQ